MICQRGLTCTQWSAITEGNVHKLRTLRTASSPQYLMAARSNAYAAATCAKAITMNNTIQPGRHDTHTKSTHGMAGQIPEYLCCVSSQIHLAAACAPALLLQCDWKQDTISLSIT